MSRCRVSISSFHNDVQVIAMREAVTVSRAEAGPCLTWEVLMTDLPHAWDLGRVQICTLFLVQVPPYRPYTHHSSDLGYGVLQLYP